MKDEQRFDFLLRVNWQKTARIYNAEAAKHGYSMPQAQVLLVVPKEGIPSSSLGPRLGMEASSLTRTLKTLELSKLIERKSDDEDGRIARVFLTKEGLRIRNIAKEKVLKYNEIFYEMLSEQERNLFFDVMRRMYNKLDDPKLFKK